MATMTEVDHYDFSHQRLPRQEAQNTFKAEASKQIKAMNQKLSTLTLEKKNRHLSKYLMKKKKKEERKKKSQNKYKKSMKEPHSNFPICACCVEYTGKMKRDIDRWAKATRKELQRMYPDMEENWRKKQELLRKKELEMRVAYEKSLEDKDEGEHEDDEDEEEKEEQEKKQEEKVGEQKEGEEEKRERIEKEKNERNRETEKERGICCTYENGKKNGSPEIVAFFGYK